MMEEDDGLPSGFDIVVLGTGMPESILSAAAARVGQTVLHIDSNEYYGGYWASFNFYQILDWGKHFQSSDRKTWESGDLSDVSHVLEAGESVVQLSSNLEIISNVEISQSIPDEGAASDGEVENGEEIKKIFWTLNSLKMEKRKFNLDLAPKLLFSRGPLVELLISSNISRYTEFKSAMRVLTFIEDKLLQVPCSRADVFSTKDVSIVEKRMLMKFLSFCHKFQEQPQEYQGFENKSFKEFLRSKKLMSNVEHYLIHAIAMVDPSVTTIQALEKIQNFLMSLGRYGNSPFLWPIYGSGELPQCFCRLCAVFGGIYYLNRKIDAIIVNEANTCTGIISKGKRISCKWLIMNPTFAPQAFLPNNLPDERISRGIFITDASILPVEKEQLTLLRLPEELVGSATTVLELGHGACVCPKGLYVVHMTCESKELTAEQDIAPARSKLFKDDIPGIELGGENNNVGPKVLWSLTFNQWAGKENFKTPINVFVTLLPDSELDYEQPIQQAKEIFRRMNPEKEFLPRAPDPEEIILDTSNLDDDNNRPHDDTHKLDDNTLQPDNDIPGPDNYIP